MKILGIDPGTRNLGYAILEKDVNKITLIEAVLVKMKAENVQFQMTQMSEESDQIFSAHKIDEVAIESMFYAYNPQSVLTLAQLRGAQIVFVIAQFAQSRIEHFITLAKARAIENQIFICAVNGFGDTGQGESFCGNSMLIGPGG